MTSTPAIDIWYYDMGGRSAVARLALAYAGIPFTFHPIDMAEWPSISSDHSRFPLEDIPVLRTGDRVISQSSAISTYAGVLSGLWPQDAVGVARIAEIHSTIEEIYTSYFGTCFYKILPFFNTNVPEVEMAKRKEEFKQHLTFYAARIDEVVKSNSNTAYAVGESLTIADFYVWELAVFMAPYGVEAPFEGINRVAATVNCIDKPGFNELRAQFGSS